MDCKICNLCGAPYKEDEEYIISLYKFEAPVEKIFYPICSKCYKTILNYLVEHASLVFKKIEKEIESRNKYAEMIDSIGEKKKGGE